MSWTWAETLDLTVKQNVGIGTDTPSQPLEVKGNIKLEKGSAINEFSSDDTLTDNSDQAVPTERAVKTYVKSQVEQVGTTLGQRIDQARTDLVQQIGQTKTDLGQQVNQTKTDLEQQISQTKTNLGQQIDQINTNLNQKANLHGSTAENFAASNLTVDGALQAQNLRVLGNLEVDGITTFRDVERHEGDVELGNADTDQVKIRGFLRSTHSSNALKIASHVDMGDDVTSSNLTVKGNVKATAFQGDGSALTGVIHDLNSVVKKTGDTIAGSLTVSGTVETTALKLKIAPNQGYVLTSDAQGNGSWQQTGWAIAGNNLSPTVNGYVGIGTATPATKLDVAGTVKATAFQGDGSALTGVIKNLDEVIKKTGEQSIQGSLAIQQKLTVGNAIFAAAYPQFSDFTLEVMGSATGSQPADSTYLKVNGTSSGMDTQRGLNTVILNPNGTVKIKASYDISQDPSQWNSWADWVTKNATDGDLVIAASYGAVSNAPLGGSAEGLFNSMYIGSGASAVAFRAAQVDPRSPYVLMFIKGQTLLLEQSVGYSANSPTTNAQLNRSYYQLLNYSGRVGIGTVNPRAKLEVIGEYSTNALVVTGSTETIAKFSRPQGDASVLLESGSGNEVYLRFKNQETGNKSWMAGIDNDEQFKIAYGNDGEIIGNQETKLVVSRNGDLNVGNTFFVGGLPSTPNYTIEVMGSVDGAQRTPVNYLKINGQAVAMDNQPGLNTVILNLNGAPKTKASHNIAQDAAQWNIWADWVNGNAKQDEIVVVASYSAVSDAPRGGSAEQLLNFIRVREAFDAAKGDPRSPYVLVFIKNVWGVPAIERSIAYNAAQPIQSVILTTTLFDLFSPYFGKVGIGTTNPQAKLQVSGGAIMPSAGNSEAAGIFFPKDPYGGGGDAAWVRYYSRTGEACTLEIGISNDADDHLALMPSGRVGIGTTIPQAKLHVIGDIRAEGKISGDGAVIPGMIVMWSGRLENIPAGWILCDGNNGTPNLTSRFIVGAGRGVQEVPGAFGEPDQHTHIIDLPVTTVDTSWAGVHSHLPPDAWYDCSLVSAVHGPTSEDFRNAIDRGGDSMENARTSAEGNHAHSVRIDYPPINTSVSSGANRPRWYALCFIMKL